jgi:hypothetical protein
MVVDSFEYVNYHGGMRSMSVANSGLGLMGTLGGVIWGPPQGVGQGHLGHVLKFPPSQDLPGVANVCACIV